MVKLTAVVVAEAAAMTLGPIGTTTAGTKAKRRRMLRLPPTRKMSPRQTRVPRLYLAQGTAACHRQGHLDHLDRRDRQGYQTLRNRHSAAAAAALP